MEQIEKNLSDAAKEQFKAGNLGVTAAYETSKLPEGEQDEIAAQAAAGEGVRAKEIAEKVKERQAGDDYRTPHPESITSLCYSCLNYSTCNVKTDTCEKCDEYVNKAEAEKTDEQRYNEEQDRIDRETARKLREKEDAERMAAGVPKNEPKTHDVKLAASWWNDVTSGKKRFELRKSDRSYKVGDKLLMQEYAAGAFTGRTILADITYMLEEYTGLAEGYAILGIELVKVSETDTAATESEGAE